LAPNFGVPRGFSSFGVPKGKKPLSIPKFDTKHWSSKRFFELWRVERKKNLSTFQILVPDFKSLKAFSGIPWWSQG
jgi:hypothetical protein